MQSQRLKKITVKGVELNNNRILEHLANEMRCIAKYDLSSNTSAKFEEIDQNDFYQFALNEILTNFSKIECNDFIDAVAASDVDEEIFYDSLDYNRALHAACDKFLGTTFF